MIGIGILVLLLLVISIGSALKSPSRTDSGHQGADNNGQRNIDLSGSDAGPSSPGATAPTANNAQNGAPVTTPSGQQRVELPGNMADALSQQGSQVNGGTAQMNGQGPVSTLPTAARWEPKQTPMVPSADRQTARPPKAAASSRAPAPSASSTSSGGAAGSIQSAPAGYYTLQLSSASQPATLNAYARQQQLSHYWVYQTRRDGKPWYVLVNGVYPSLSQAKNAVAKLPADVQAKKPWARQIGQVKKDQNN